MFHLLPIVVGCLFKKLASSARPSSGVTLPFDMVAVAPHELSRFERQHPDAVDAVELLAGLERDGRYPNVCAALRGEIADGRRRYPGCLYFCCNFKT